MAALTAKFILEILGRPPEHLKGTINELVDKMGTEKGVAILKKEIHDLKKVEKAENLWTTFAEVELRFESIPLFFSAMITYLPAHVEVYEPDLFKLNAYELNEFANFIISRLHNYDALAKRMMGERDILINKLEYLRKGGDPKKVFAPEQKQADKQIAEDNKPKKAKKKGKK